MILIFPGFPDFFHFFRILSIFLNFIDSDVFNILLHFLRIFFHFSELYRFRFFLYFSHFLRIFSIFLNFLDFDFFNVLDFFFSNFPPIFRIFSGLFGIFPFFRSFHFFRNFVNLKLIFLYSAQTTTKTRDEKRKENSLKARFSSASRRLSVETEQEHTEVRYHICFSRFFRLFYFFRNFPRTFSFFNFPPDFRFYSPFFRYFQFFFSFFPGFVDTIFNEILNFSTV